MRANGTRTPREQANELGRIDAQLTAAQMVLAEYGAWFDGIPVPEVIGTAWNALHDAVTALEAEWRTVALNTPCMDATALLIHQNID